MATFVIDTNKINEIKLDISSNALPKITSCYNTVVSVKSNLPKEVTDKEYLWSSLPKLYRKIDNIYDDVVKINNLLYKAIEKMNDAEARMIKWNSIKDGAIQAGREFVSDVKDFGADIYEGYQDTKEWFENTWNEVYETGCEVVESVENWVENLTWEDVKDFFKTTAATIVVAFQSFTKGLITLLQMIVDLFIIVGTMAVTPFTAIADGVNYLLTGESGGYTKYYWDGAMNMVADVSSLAGNCCNWLTENNPDWINENSLIEAGGTVDQIIQGIGYMVGIIGITVATFGTATPAALALTAGSLGFAKGTSEAWEKGKDAASGLLMGAINGGWEALQYYVGGKIGTSVFKGITSKIASPIFRKLVVSGIRIGLDSATGAVEVPFQSVVSMIDTRVDDIEGNELSWDEAWEASGGWIGVIQQTAIAGVGSLGGEVIDFGKAFKNSKVKGTTFGDALDDIYIDDLNTAIKNKENPFGRFSKSKETTKVNVDSQMDDILKKEKSFFERFGTKHKTDSDRINGWELMEQFNENLLKADEYDNLLKNVNLEDYNLYKQEIALGGCGRLNATYDRLMKLEMEIPDYYYLEKLTFLDNGLELSNLKRLDGSIFSLKNRETFYLGNRKIFAFDCDGDIIYSDIDLAKLYANGDFVTKNFIKNEFLSVDRISNATNRLNGYVGYFITDPSTGSLKRIRIENFEKNLKLKNKDDLLDKFYSVMTSDGKSDNRVVDLLYKAFRNNDNSDADNILRKVLNIKNNNPDLRFLAVDSGCYWQRNISAICIEESTINMGDVGTMCHELGHCLFDSVLGGKLPDNWNRIEALARVFSTHNGTIKNLEDILKFDSQTANNKSFIELNNRLLSQTGMDYNQYCNQLISQYDDLLRIPENELRLRLKTFNFNDDMIDMIVNGDYSSRNLALIELDNMQMSIKEEICRIEYSDNCALSDILDSVYGGYKKDLYGNPIFVTYQHGSKYYEDATSRGVDNYPLHEQIANFTQLKLTGKQESLDLLKNVFGEEYYNALEDIFNKFLS